MCSRKYNIRLCLEYNLEDVLLVNRAKTTAGPPSFAPLCSLPATLGCYSLMKSVISVGVDNV